MFQQAVVLPIIHQITHNRNLLRVTVNRIVLHLPITEVQAVLLQEVIQPLLHRVRAEVTLRQEVRAVVTEVQAAVVQEVVGHRIQVVQEVREAVQVEVREVQVLHQAVVNLPLQQIE